MVNKNCYHVVRCLRARNYMADLMTKFVVYSISGLIYIASLENGKNCPSLYYATLGYYEMNIYMFLKYNSGVNLKLNLLFNLNFLNKKIETLNFNCLTEN